ncbi:MAG: hypothetical protein ABJB04_00310 [Betaproteobacteria bacterium]
MAKFFGMFQSSAVDEDALSSPKSVNAWAETHPANDPMGMIMGMTHLLEELSTKQPEVTPNRVQAMLALDRVSQAPLAQLQNQYRMPGLSDDVRQQLWHARNNLARWFAYAYEQIYESIRNRPDRAKFQASLHGVFSRLFHYRGVQARQGLFRYEQWIPAKWKFLHAAFKEALEVDVAHAMFSITPNAPPAEQCSPEQEYVHFLLMQRVNTGNLSVPQIDLASIWLRDWVPSLHLTSVPPEGQMHWLLDLSQAEGLMTPGPEQTTSDTRLFLDVSPLRDRLAELKTQLDQAIAQGPAKPEVRELKDKLALGRRLESLWLPHAKLQTRRGEREPAQQAVLVSTGWSELSIFMREARPWKPHDPYHYTYDDATDLVARGRTPAPKGDKADGFNNLHPDRRGWKIHDISETGCRIVSTTKQAAQMQLGALVGLLRETDPTWRVAIVRRLKRRTADHTELGLEIIAENSLLVMPEPVVMRDTGHNVTGIDVSAKGKRFDALYLPPQQSSATPVYSIVVPVGEYAAGKLLTLALGGDNRLIRLAVAIEYNRDWVWTTFEVVTPPRG